MIDEQKHIGILREILRKTVNQEGNDVTWLLEDSDFVASYFIFAEMVYYNVSAIEAYIKQYMTTEFLDYASHKVSCQRIAKYRPEALIRKVT